MRAAAFALVGLAFGSFLTVVIHRIPRRESVVAPRSRCPGCGTQLRAIDNVPVLSYVLLRGRCRACGEPISAEYPLIEVATAVLFVAAALLIEPLFAAAMIAPFLAVMLAIAVIDARWQIVPNLVVYPSLLLFGAAIAAGHILGGGVDGLSALGGMALYGGPLLLLALALPHGMGMGDVKLAALIGLVLGSLGLSLVAVAAGVGIIGGGLAALLALLVLRYGRKQQIPFGPFLAGGAVVAALVGGPLAETYLSLYR